MKLYAIYVPHITEHIYQEFFKQYEQETSIHLSQWVKPTDVNADIIIFGEKLKDIISEMRKFKSEHNLSMATEMELLVIRTEKRFVDWFKQTEKDMQACTKAKDVKYQVE